MALLMSSQTSTNSNPHDDKFNELSENIYVIYLFVQQGTKQTKCSNSPPI